MPRWKAFVIIALLSYPVLTTAVTLDDFGGRMDVSCPANPHKFAASCSQAGTTSQLCTYTGGAITVSNSVAGSYTVTIGASSFTIAINEPMIISGTSTALDWTFTANNNHGGMAVIASVNTGTGVVTLTAPASHTVSNTAGFLTPGRWYTATITTPFGTGPQICTPEGHWEWVQMISDASWSLVGGVGSGSAWNVTGLTGSVAAGVVTQTSGSGMSHIILGAPITMSLCSDSTYNGTFTITSVASNAKSFTYADGGAGAGGATGCRVDGNGWDSKYGSDCSTVSGLVSKFLSFSFNMLGDDSDGKFQPDGGCTYNYMPTFDPVATPSFTQYPAGDAYGCIPQAVKIATAAQDRQMAAGGGAYGTPVSGQYASDFFDPNWGPAIVCTWSTIHGNNGPSSYSVDSPFLMGMTIDDSDGLKEGRSGPWWHSVPAQKNSANISLEYLFSAPQITLGNHNYFNSGNLENTPHLYPVTTNYTKALSGSPPASCSDAAPCSLLDFLRNEYGTIANLNAAWGSTYTQFASTQSTFTGETVATPASYTFANTNVTPNSIAVFLTPSPGTFGASSVMVSGDCPMFHTTTPIMEVGCPTGVGVGEGSFIAPGAFQTSFNFELGHIITDSNGDIEKVTISGKTASSAPSWPATNSCSGTQTTVSGGATFTCIGPGITGTITYTTGASTFTIGGAGSLPTGEVLSVSYTTGGWGTSSCCGGLQDEDGRSSWVTLNGICLVAPPAWAASTSYTAYDDGSVIAVTVSATPTWQMATTSHTSGLSAPTFSATAGQLSSDNNWTSLGSAVSDATVGDFKVACPARTAQTIAFASDMNAWAEQQVSEYASVEQQSATNIWPDVMDFGENFSNYDWGNPSWLSTFKAINQFTDAAFWGQYNNGSQGFDPEVTIKQAYTQAHYSKAYIVEQFETTSSGFESPCTPVITNCWAGLTAMANGFYSQVQAFQALKSPSGSFQESGITWWRNINHFNSIVGAPGAGDSGLFTTHDNVLDGNENVTSAVSCSAPLQTLTCGGELAGVPWLGVNIMTISQGVVPALTLWKSASPSLQNGPATKSIMMARIIDPAWIAAQTKYEGRLF